jgi:hypothetical protein
VAAILTHHGGWAERGVLALDPRWKQTVANIREDAARIDLTPLARSGVARVFEIDLPSVCVGDFETWWPLAAYVLRNLRLSDQMATEEGNNG